MVFSTAMKPTKEKLKKMFALHGVPKREQSYNDPPFNSKEFVTFAREDGFDHHRVTPENPRANGQVERYMQVLNKIEQISHFQGKTGLHRNMAVYDMLMAYSDTPHTATEIIPYQGMLNRPTRTKLDHTVPRERSEHAFDEKDQFFKEEMSRDGVNIKEHNYLMGDYVLLRQKKVNKWSTAYEPIFYTVIRISGSTITARRVTDGREICRESRQFKLANAFMHEEGAKGGNSEDWRETLLMNSGSTNQPSGQVVQPQAIPEQSDLPEESVANGSSGNANQQLEELPTVSTEEGSTSSSSLRGRGRGRGI